MHSRLSPRIAALSLLLFASSACLAQNAVLKLDNDPKGRCAKHSEGGMWIVRDTTVNNISAPKTYTMTVTLTMSPVSGGQSRQIVRFLPAGGSSELGCSEGKDGASYTIVSAK